jgi:hypothetical protein
MRRWESFSLIPNHVSHSIFRRGLIFLNFTNSFSTSMPGQRCEFFSPDTLRSHASSKLSKSKRRSPGERSVMVVPSQRALFSAMQNVHTRLPYTRFLHQVLLNRFLVGFEISHPSTSRIRASRSKHFLSEYGIHVTLDARELSSCLQPAIRILSYEVIQLLMTVFTSSQFRCYQPPNPPPVSPATI